MNHTVLCIRDHYEAVLRDSNATLTGLPKPWRPQCPPSEVQDTEASRLFFSRKEWVNQHRDYGMDKLLHPHKRWNAITHPCPSVNGGSMKLPLRLAHRRVITSHMKQWLWLLLNVLVSAEPSLIARFMGPTWGPSGPMLAQWTLLPGMLISGVQIFLIVASISLRYTFLSDEPQSQSNEVIEGYVPRVYIS